MLITQHQHSGARRAGFTLLEVLVVVAIIVILAGGASIYVFGYLEDAKINSARTSMAQLENACKNYATSSGNPPATLMEVVQPTNGTRPLVDGGEASLLDPWGKAYQYDPSNVNAYGDPDPIVWTVTREGTPLYSTKRR